MLCGCRSKFSVFTVRTSALPTPSKQLSWKISRGQSSACARDLQHCTTVAMMTFMSLPLYSSRLAEGLDGCYFSRDHSRCEESKRSRCRLSVSLQQQLSGPTAQQSGCFVGQQFSVTRGVQCRIEQIYFFVERARGNGARFPYRPKACWCSLPFSPAFRPLLVVLGFV